MPDTGGANIPALNDLLSSWGIAFGDRVYEGDFTLGGHNMYYASGTTLARFPSDGTQVWRSLKDQGEEVLEGDPTDPELVSIMGLYQTQGQLKIEVPSENSLNHEEEAVQVATTGGRIIVYGDSNCLDNSHMQKDCFWTLDAILDYAVTGGEIPLVFLENPEESASSLPNNAVLPKRMEGNQLHRYSKVLDPLGQNSVEPQKRPLPMCSQLVYSVAIPLNKSAPSNLYQSQKLLSISVDSVLPIVPVERLHNPFQTTDLDVEESTSVRSNRWSMSTKSALMVMTVVALMALCQFYRNRVNRPRRRKTPRLKRSSPISTPLIKPPTV